MWFAFASWSAHAGELEELPFHRIVDVGLTVPGLPDFAGAKVEVWPTRHLSVEAGVSTAIFINSLTGMVLYRWDLKLVERDNGSINQLMLGPGVGVRHVSYLCFDACQDPSVYADALASLQFDHWFQPHLGLQVQVDAGASVYLLRLETPYGRTPAPPILPVVRLGFGLSL